MPRSLSSLALAAAVAAAAAVGASVPARSTEPAPTQTTAAAPVAATVQPGPATDAGGRTARVVLPTRDSRIAQAPPPPAPAPPAPEPPIVDHGGRPAPRSLRGTGELLAAAGTSVDPVDRGGRTVRFSVEVEAATGLDPDATAALVEEALYDARSWARDRELQRVAPADASLHVVIATPSSVDALCRRADLNTNGWLSCWNGSVAAINLDRWQVGVSHVEDLAQYRRYVVNHEVGHGLGFGHRDCPGDGQLAPLMQQQTKSLSGCVANEWAHP